MTAQDILALVQNNAGEIVKSATTDDRLDSIIKLISGASGKSTAGSILDSITGMLDGAKSEDISGLVTMALKALKGTNLNLNNIPTDILGGELGAQVGPVVKQIISMISR